MRKTVISLFAALALALGAVGAFTRGDLWPSTANAQDTQTQETQTQPVTPVDEDGALLQDEQNTIEVVGAYGPSVVSVNVEIRGQRFDPFEQFGNVPEEFRRFFQLPQGQQPEEFRQQGSGSGFVVSDEGDIITNYHVVVAALEEDEVTLREGSSLSVTFPSSDEEFSATVVGANSLYDLALLRLDDPDALPEGIRSISIADSEAVRVGQKVIAIGNPFGFASTVTTGIVSGVSRSLPGVGEVNIPLIQTDAAINPGNSGGPLLNSRGELIGVNTAIIPGLSVGGARGNIGIGFAVPSNLLRNNLAELQQGGFTDIGDRPRLGVRFADLSVFPESIRENLSLPEQGVSVQAVEAGSAAERAGLQGGQYNIEVDGQELPLQAGGDIILAVNGQAVSSGGELQDLILSQEDGDTVELTVWRDGEELSVPVTLSVVPQEEQTVQAESDGTEDESDESTGGPQLGVSVQDVSSYPEAVRESLTLPEAGVVVVAVAPQSAAEEAGLRGSQFTLEAEGERYPAGGDVITAADGQRVNTAQDLVDIVQGKEPGEALELSIWRDGQEETVSATLPETSNN